MSWTIELCWTLARAILVATVCVGLAEFVEIVCRTTRSVRYLIIITIGVSLCLPGLLIGYAYADVLSYLRFPFWPAEGLYLLVMIARNWPWCYLMTQLGRSNEEERQSLYLLGLLKSSPVDKATIQSLKWQQLCWRWKQFGSRHLAGWCFTVLTVFQDFEIASLMSVVNWNVRLFDAQAAGLNWDVTTKWCLAGVLVQLLFVWPVLKYLLKRRHDESQDQQTQVVRHRVWKLYTILGLCCFVLLASVLWLGSDFVSGLAVLKFGTQWRMLGWGILGNAIIGIFSVAILWGFSAAMILLQQQRITSRSARTGGAVVKGGLSFLLLVGLTGELPLAILGLSLQRLPLVFTNLPVLQQILDGTPLLAIVLVSLWLWPRWWIVAQVIESRSETSSRWLLKLLSKSSSQHQKAASRLGVWHLAGRQFYGLLVVLFCWAYTEVLITSVLTPVGYETATVRLYNLMHYGHNVVLALMTLAFSIAPVLVGLILLGLVYVSLRRWR